MEAGNTGSNIVVLESCLLTECPDSLFIDTVRVMAGSVLSVPSGSGAFALKADLVLPCRLGLFTEMFWLTSAPL
jgi:hypothetical protein